MKKVILSFALSLLLFNISTAQLCFLPAKKVGKENTFVTSVISVDINNDKNIDLVFTYEDGKTIYVLFGNGSGEFLSETQISVSTPPRSVISADFNGDGKIDLATANPYSNNVSVFLGNGMGGFFAEKKFTVGTQPVSLISADFNKDGKIDLATSNEKSDNMTILLGNGLGDFLSGTNFNVGIGPRSIVSSDFNGDGNLDIATSNFNFGNVTVLLGNGTGGFTTSQTFFVGTSPTSITCNDFNGDGKKDLAIANAVSQNISVVLGNGSGTFSSTTNYPLSGSPRDIKSVDINDDNKIDLVTANSNSNNNSVSILLGNDSGVFAAENNITANNTPSSIICDDLNKDGKKDITIGNGNYIIKSSSLSIFFGDLSFTISSTNNNCKGGKEGSATVNVTCGNSPSYSWNTTPVQTTPSANALSAGTYTVTITDGKMIKTAGVTITEPSNAIAIGITKTDASCSGVNSDGSAIAVATGGTPPYIYSWNTTPKQNTSKAINLAAGNYIVTVNDAKGCVKTQNVSIGSPPQLSISIAKTDSSCSTIFGGIGWGNGNGFATATAIGGTPPYTYLWDTPNKEPFETTAPALGAGTYTVTVKDAKNCTNTANVTISSPQPIMVTEVHTDVTCSGFNNGSATINVTGGIPPYKYLWDTLNKETTASVKNLASGTFSVEITDSKGCTGRAALLIKEPQILSVEIGSTPNEICSGLCNGVMFASVEGGTKPYSYKWDAKTGSQTSSEAVGLCSDKYSVVITDANGCTLKKEEVLTSDSNFNEEVFLTNIAAVDQVNVSPAFTAFYTYNLPAKINPNPANLRNFVDPGKKARFKVECTNNKLNGKSIVSGICEVRSNSPYITITDNSSALNNIGWNNKAWSADEFEIDIKPNTPPGTIAYIDFIVKENGIEYATTCIPLPITPLNYSPNIDTIDDDSNPDSKGNDNNTCDPNEIIEFYPWLDNVSTLNAEYVRGRFENLDNLSYINIWNNKAGVNTTVFDTTWWNFSFGQPSVIDSNAIETTPEYDFVFNYNNPNKVNNFKLYMVMAGGFKLFPGDALSLVQWSLPYTFNNGTLSSNDFLQDDSLMIYPNPTTNFVTIKVNPLFIGSRYTITDVLGKIVLSGKIVKESSNINMEQFSSGLYLFKIGGQSQQTFKIIKK